MTMTALLELGGHAIYPQVWLCVGSLRGVFISLLSPLGSQDQTLSSGTWLHRPWALGTAPPPLGGMEPLVVTKTEERGTSFMAGGKSPGS